jgi:arabinosaccharide transport system substrate-binding protein
VKRFSEHLSGRMRVMPLPVFEPGDKRTATWGGTMIGITKGCENPKEAWRMIEKLYFSKEGLASRRKVSDVLPPVKSLWDDPAYHQPDPYFGGQKAYELFIELAQEIPLRYVTPATGLAQTQLNAVLAKAVNYINERGSDAGLEEAIKPWLVEAERELKGRMDQMRFDE